MEKHGLNVLHDISVEDALARLETAKVQGRIGAAAAERGGIGAVGPDRHGLAPLCLDGADNFSGTFRGFFIGDRDIRAFGGQRCCDRRAEAPAGAGYQRPFSRQCHGRLHFCSDRYRMT